MSDGAGFFERVYRLVRRVPPGRVTSYGAIASMLGHPRAARVVGWALHSLPDGSDVPWHRVINSRGRISTSCQEHNADLQRALLEAEGVEFDDQGYVDWKRFGWEGLPWPEVEALSDAARAPQRQGEHREAAYETPESL